MSPAGVGAVLCDLDGVLRRWDPQALTGLDRTCGLAEGTLAAAAFHPGRLRPAITGQVTDQQWRAAAADLAGACGSAQRGQALVAGWAALPGEVDQDVLALLTEARQHVPVVLVSNATTRLEADLARLGLDEAVDDVVNSARVGVAKPDREIYLIAARRASTVVERCLFVNDTAVSVEAARAVGMVGLHYRDHAQLRRALVG